MLLRATENAMAGHIWSAVRYLPTLVYTHWKAAQRSSKDQVEWTASPTLLGPVLVWSQQNCLRLLLNVRYFVSS